MSKYTLPAPFAEKWLAALRDGSYEQGQSALHNRGDDTYCCLGVAAAMCGVQKDLLGDSGYVCEVNSNTIDHEEDPEMARELSVTAVELGYPTELLRTDAANDLASTLAEMNDAGDSFTEIADWIQENVRFVDPQQLEIKL